jgi:class 3 adenylate cyclase
METLVLEKTLIKLGGLLALGLGEAGIDIVGSNLSSDKLNAMVPGRRMEAILGFVDIRGFALAADVLNEKVMMFVNHIAEIIHAICDIHCGAPNKNNGDTFLLVWQIGSEEYRSKMADLCILSSVKACAAVQKSPVLYEYRRHPGLIARNPKFRVGVGFGLHTGWAIEGALGSQLKIDASYLSPHVALTLMMEGTTKIYGVPIMVSDTLSQVMDVHLAQLLRPVDCVFLPGSRVPVEILSMDLHVDEIQVKPYTATTSGSKEKNRIKQIRNVRKDAFFTEEGWTAVGEFSKDKYLVQMREKYTKPFFQAYQKGYLNYRAGEWDVAMEAFQESLDMLEFSDGPSRALIDYISSNMQYGGEGYGSDRKSVMNGVAPKTWKGVRELHDVRM